jgi:hypothetical protein
MVETLTLILLTLGSRNSVSNERESLKSRTIKWGLYCSADVDRYLEVHACAKRYDEKYM